MVSKTDKVQSIRKRLIPRKIAFSAVGALLLVTQTGCSQHRSSLGVKKGGMFNNLFNTSTKPHASLETNSSIEGKKQSGSSKDGQNRPSLDVDEQLKNLIKLRADLTSFSKSQVVIINKKNVDIVLQAIQQVHKAISDLIRLLSLQEYVENCKTSENRPELSHHAPRSNNSIGNKKQLVNSTSGQSGFEFNVNPWLEILESIANELIAFYASKFQTDCSTVSNAIVSVKKAWQGVSELSSIDYTLSNEGGSYYAIPSSFKEISGETLSNKEEPDYAVPSSVRSSQNLAVPCNTPISSSVIQSNTTESPLLSCAKQQVGQYLPSIEEERNLMQNEDGQGKVDLDEILDEILENFDTISFELDELLMESSASSNADNVHTESSNQPPPFVKNSSVAASTVQKTTKIDSGGANQDHPKMPPISLEDVQAARTNLRSTSRDAKEQASQTGLNPLQEKWNKMGINL